MAESFLHDERGQDAWIFDELLAGKDDAPDAYTQDIATLVHEQQRDDKLVSGGSQSQNPEG